MPWNDCVFENWSDCEWIDWADVEPDTFSSQDRTIQKRTTRLLSPQAMGDYGRRPYLEAYSKPDYISETMRQSDQGKQPYSEGYSNPDYVSEMNTSDKSFADAKMLARQEEVRHLQFKQPYRYDTFQKMKYKNESAFPYQDYQDNLSVQLMAESPQDIIDEAIITEPEYEWKWVSYFDNSKYTPIYEGDIYGQWFDDRWIPFYDPDIDMWSCYVFPQGTWYRNFRPIKIRATFDGTQSLDFTVIDDMYNEIERLYDATYSSGTEKWINWAGRNIEAIWFDWPIGQDPVLPYASAIENIEFYQQVEKGTYLASDQRIPRKSVTIVSGRAKFPGKKIQRSKRLARAGRIRPTRGGT